MFGQYVESKSPLQCNASSRQTYSPEYLYPSRAVERFKSSTAFNFQRNHARLSYTSNLQHCMPDNVSPQQAMYSGQKTLELETMVSTAKSSDDTI